MSDSNIKTVPTTEQLSSIVEAIVAKINTKLTSGEIVPADNGIILGEQIKIEYDPLHEYIVFKTLEDQPREVFLRIPDQETQGSIVAVMQNAYDIFEALYLLADRIKVGDMTYSFPSSTAETKSQSYNARYGGGTILTSRYRSFPKTAYTVTDTGHTGESVSVYPNIYTIITLNGNAVVTLQNNTDGSVDEFWIQVDLPEVPSEVGTLRRITFTNSDERLGDISWAGGEPQWDTLSHVRIQIHIINNMATWSWVELPETFPILNN